MAAGICVNWRNVAPRFVPLGSNCGCNAVFFPALPLTIVTRATLLHVLERPTALGPAEVRELEQLAQAFPYCQTAHLLLAKAAHDQGTMLAGQRLRRAATYAADRTLLRRLIEQEEPKAEAAAAIPEPAALPAAPHPLDLVDWPDEYVPPTATPAVAPPRPVAVATPSPAEASPPVSPVPAPAASAAEVPVVAAPVAGAETAAARVTPPPPELVAPLAPAPVLVPELLSGAALVVPAELPATALAVAAEPAAMPVAAASAEAPAAASAEAPVAEAPAPIAPPALPAFEITGPPPAAEKTAAAVAGPGPAVAPEPAAPPVVEQPAPMAASLPQPVPEPVAPAAPEAAVIPAPVPVPAPVARQPEAELPAQAPAIRPPVEVGEARFEFGLADSAPAAALATYELPGLIDEWAASAVTRSMGSPKALAPATPAPAAPVFTPAAFTGDAVVGYAFGESSRLGLSMQLLDLLAATAEAAESATAVVAAAQPPATALPPTGTFFEPDQLLLGHWATHRPAAPELPSTVDLINNFLKRQPRLTRPAMLPPAATHQADLSVRSTRTEPDLVSENLARIFVRQGKTARAIEIYEKLMVKQPEKMAYFALQIQSLQPSA